jgi:hypothetical protein
LRGPFRAAQHDRTTFCQELKAAIQKKQLKDKLFRVIADDGCFANDLVGLLSYRNELDPRHISWFKDRALSRHEKVNGRSKHFRTLDEDFRHDRGWNPNGEFPRHKAVVEAMFVTIQVELDLGELELIDAHPH